MSSPTMAAAISGVDRISALPDAILLHILFFLCSKTVVATSILSKRWRNLWHSAPAVDLDDSRFSGNGDLFVRFVYAVMLSRDLTQPILKFRLKCHNSSYAQCDVNTWVNAAILRRVETFELSLFPAMNNSAMKLPTGILTCSTLVVLKLTKVRVGHSFIVQLPARKTLYMHGVEFARNENLENFLSGCPNLNHLQISTNLYLWLSSSRLVRTFGGLIHVNLSLYDCPWRLILGMLNSCPLLQNFVIRKVKSGTEGLDLQNQPYPVPGCFSSQLRSCTLNNFHGSEVDIQFAIYVMQNASLLKTMTICCSSASSDREKLQILKKICKFPTRISKTCELLFE